MKYSTKQDAYHLIYLHVSPFNSNVIPGGWNFPLSIFQLRPCFLTNCFFSAYQKKLHSVVGFSSTFVFVDVSNINSLQNHWGQNLKHICYSAKNSGALVPNEFVGDISQQLLSFHLRYHLSAEETCGRSLTLLMEEIFYPLGCKKYILYVPWSKVAILGMVIPPLIGILKMGI